MIKRTLIAIAVVALLATSAHAAITDHYFPGAVKVDGSDTPTLRWPYEIVYEELVVCNIPITMQVGMYVQVKDCKDLKIVLKQVNCDDIKKDNPLGCPVDLSAGDYPCYHGWVDIQVRSNFDVKLGTELHKDGDIIDEWVAFYDDDTIDKLVGYQTVKLNVVAWKAMLYAAEAHDNVSVGSVDVTVKPQ